MDTCILCKSSKKDEIQYGEFLKKKRFGVHTFCLYLSSNLPQNGADDEGFLGFLEADIKQEVQRISLLKCCYCQKKYANVGCCQRRCRRSFHFICGLENKAENQFCHEFRSFCHDHATKVRQRPNPSETCLICYDSLCENNGKFDSSKMILTPCCGNGWFHKLCLQKFAKTAGYFFKCPLCNDANTFREKLPERGIFIPNQDAAWELEPNAFAELLERPNECAAPQCSNRNGRKSFNNNNPFVFCSTCGSTAMHRQCLPNGGGRFHCADCTLALEEGDSGRESLNLHQGNQDEDEEIDVCHVSDKEDLELANRLFGLVNNNQAGTSKRDSGSHCDDDEVARPRSRNCGSRRKNNIDTESDSEDSDKIKPVKASTSRRLPSDSDSTEDNMPLKSLNVKINSRTTGSKESQKNSKACSSSRRLRLNSSASNDSSLFQNDNQDKDYREEKTTKVNKNKEIQSDKSTSSDDEEIVRISRKRKSLNLLKDSKEVTNGVTTAKQKRLDSDGTETTDTFESDFMETEESEDDDDPLENFSKIIEKQKNISCIALRTRRSQNFKNQQLQEQPQNSQGSSEKENERNEANFTNNRRKSPEKHSSKHKGRMAPLKDEPQIMDISCIAKRTRRKSMDLRSNSKNEKENPLNISCIAVRTRRKTICAESNYKPESLYEMSQIYEKVHESEDDDGESVIYDLTEDDSEFNEVLVDTDLDNFIVDDSYEQRDNKFEISCIANRTRKRKSLKSHESTLFIIDENDSRSSTNSSSNSSSLPSTINRRRRYTPSISSNSSDDFVSANTSCSSTNSSTNFSSLSSNVSQRRPYSISSNSSDDFVAPQTTAINSRQAKKTKSISPNILLDKLPQHNYTAFLQPKYNTKSSSMQQKYHLKEYYYPVHNKNRNRF